MLHRRKKPSELTVVFVLIYFAPDWRSTLWTKHAASEQAVIMWEHKEKRISLCFRYSCVCSPSCYIWRYWQSQQTHRKNMQLSLTVNTAYWDHDGVSVSLQRSWRSVYMYGLRGQKSTLVSVFCYSAQLIQIPALCGATGGSRANRTLVQLPNQFQTQGTWSLVIATLSLR